MPSYQGWSQVSPPKAKKGKAPRKPKINRPFPGYLTPSEIRKMAVSQATAELDPARTDIRRQQQEAGARSDSQGRAILAASQAAAEMMKGIGPQVNSMYQTAAANQAAIGKGYSGGLQEAQNAQAAQTNAQLANIGAPEGQMQHPGPEAANVLYGLGGAIPASTFSREGAAFGAAASMLPATALGRGQQEFATNVARGQQEQAGFERALRDMDSKFPGMLSSVISGMNKEQLQLFSLNLQAQYLGLNKVKEVHKNTLGVAKLNYQARNDAANRQAKVAAAAQTAAQKKVDKAAGNRKSAVAARENAFFAARPDAVKIAADYAPKPMLNPAPDPFRSPGKYVLAAGKVSELGAGATSTNDESKARKDGGNYTKAFNAVWNQVAPGVLRYTSGAGKAAMKRRLRTMVKQVLAQLDLKPSVAKAPAPVWVPASENIGP